MKTITVYSRSHKRVAREAQIKGIVRILNSAYIQSGNIDNLLRLANGMTDLLGKEGMFFFSKKNGDIRYKEYS